ncbi:hypothetical protein GCM10027408_01880 [Microbacterium tumbae]
MRHAGTIREGSDVACIGLRFDSLRSLNEREGAHGSLNEREGRDARILPAR